MTAAKEITPTDRLIRKGVIIAGLVTAVIAGWFMWAVSTGTNESDVTEACNSRVLETITGAQTEDITDVSARKSPIDSDPEYANEWSASGTITSDYMTGVNRRIPYTCTLYMDSTGNELDGKVSIGF